MLSRASLSFLLSLAAAATAHAQVAENTARLCQNGVDDDGDGLIDCDDDGCAQLIFCVAARRAAEEAARREVCDNELDDDGDGLVDCDDDDCAADCRRSLTLGRTTDRGIYRPAAPPARLPDVGFRRHTTEANYPTAWAAHPMTLRRGMFVPRLGVAIEGAPFASDPGGRLGLGASYGIFEFWDVTLVAVPLTLAPTVEYESPAIASTLRFLGLRELEIGLAVNVAVPVASPRPGYGVRDPFPFRTLLGHAALFDVANLETALLARVHVEDILRIDLTLPVVQILFTESAAGRLDPEVDVGFVADVGVSITDYAFLGVTTGALLRSRAWERPVVPLGFFAGAVIGGWRRGPFAELEVRFVFPRLYQEAAGDPVVTDVWQFTFDVRVFTFLLN